MRYLLVGLVTITLAFAAFYPNPALAQEKEDKAVPWAIVLGAGIGLPARGETFTDNAKVGAFIVSAVERRLSEKFYAFGKLDLSRFAAVEGSAMEATTWGGGIGVTFDIFPDNNWTGGFKIGVSRANRSDFIADPSVQPDFGGYIEGDFKGDSRIRIGIDVKLYQGTNQIAGAFLYFGSVLGI